LTGEQVDLQVDQGMITAIAPHLSGDAPRELNVQGHLVSPPFVESHIHLDSALTPGEPRFNQSGTLFEGIQIWGERKPKLTREDVTKRAIATLKQLASQGVLFVRTHLDVSPSDLTALQAMLEVREAIQEWVTLQVVAFPQDSIYGEVQTEELLEEALKLGANVVGGIPHKGFRGMRADCPNIGCTPK
ncbi:amidohydrolase family protein, partial [Phormidium pseudopriestleyi]|uniref:amidohydrolase family protein n=1 Tax=Phormidium pseudopriestleyi TaxID=1759527 RepID=UPI0030F3B869